MLHASSIGTTSADHTKPASLMDEGLLFSNEDGVVNLDLTNMSSHELQILEKVLNRNDALLAVESSRLRRLQMQCSSRSQSLNASPKSTYNNQFILNEHQHHQKPDSPERRPKKFSICPTLIRTNTNASMNLRQRFKPSPKPLLCRQCGSSITRKLENKYHSGSSSRFHRICIQMKLCEDCYNNLLLEAKSGAWFHKLAARKLQSQSSQNLTDKEIQHRPSNDPIQQRTDYQLNNHRNHMTRHMSLVTSEREDNEMMRMANRTDDNLNYDDEKTGGEHIEPNRDKALNIMNRLKRYSSLQFDAESEDEHFNNYLSHQLPQMNHHSQAQQRENSTHYLPDVMPSAAQQTNQIKQKYSQANNQELETPPHIYPKSNTKSSSLDRSATNCSTNKMSHIPTIPLRAATSNGSPLCFSEHTNQQGPQQNTTPTRTTSTLSIQSTTHNSSMSQPASSLPQSSVAGELLMEIDYNFRSSHFIVVLRQCRDLPCVDPVTNSVSSYLYILLLPDRSKKSRRTTAVKKNCCNPIFEQIFKYNISLPELETRSLLIMVCHKDDSSPRDIPVCQLVIPLAFVDFSRPATSYGGSPSVNNANGSSSMGPKWFPFVLIKSPQQCHGLPSAPHTPKRPLSNNNLQNNNQIQYPVQTHSSQSMSSNKTINNNVQLTSASGIPPYHGEISLAIKFVNKTPYNSSSKACGNYQQQSPNQITGELHVWIKSMKNVISCLTSQPPQPHNNHKLNPSSMTNVGTPYSHQNSNNYYSESSDNYPSLISSTASNLASDMLDTASSGLLGAVASVTQSQPVVRVCLLPYRNSTQATTPGKPQTSSNDRGVVVWSTILKFPLLSLGELRARSLEVTVWAHPKRMWMSRIVTPRCIGGIRLYLGASSPNPHHNCSASSPSSSPVIQPVNTVTPEERMWAALIDKPGLWIDGTLRLKMDPSFQNLTLPE